MGDEETRAALEEKVANLEIALQSRQRIGTAVGILMVSLKVTEGQAFDVLVHASQVDNRKLRDVADDVVRTGALSS